MGDMADFIILECIEFRAEFPAGEPPLSRTCRYCNKGGYHWFETERGWRLCDDGGKTHECAQYGSTRVITRGNKIIRLP